MAPYVNEVTLVIIRLCMLLAATGKSVQFGLHSLLPQSMDCPTPVSALIHAATLVTAGVYLLLRSSVLLEFSPLVLGIMTWLGILTSIFAATTGLLQNDLKRIIAYSTCSKLGYLVVELGLSNFDISLFHLVNHEEWMLKSYDYAQCKLY